MSTENISKLIIFLLKYFWFLRADLNFHNFVSESLKKIGAIHHFFTYIINKSLELWWILRSQKMHSQAVALVLINSSKAFFIDLEKSQSSI